MNELNLDELEGETIPSLLSKRLATRPNQVGFFEKRSGAWRDLTWDDYARRIAGISQSLVDHGLQRGDSVALMGDVSLEWVIAYMAVINAGGVAVGIYFTSSVAELDYFLDDSASKFIFVGGEKELNTVLRTEYVDKLKNIVVLDGDTVQENQVISAACFATPVEDHVGLLHRQAELARADQIASVVYTSGTTARPKGALLTHRSLIEGVGTLRAVCPALFREPQRVVVHLPLSHVVGMGQGIVSPLISELRPYFGESSAEFADTIKEVKPTYWMAPPRFYQRYAAQIAAIVAGGDARQRAAYRLAMSVARKALKDRAGSGEAKPFLQTLFNTCYKEVFEPLLARFGLDQLQYPYTASAPMPADVMRLWQTWGVNLKECYGQTELVGTNASQMRDWSKPGSIGEPIGDPRWQTRVAQDGEMLVSGPGLFVGYLNKPDETKEALTDGWLHTGDMVKVNEDGLLALIDRKKEIINTSGGKSISPAQIENEIRQSPYISEAAVCGDGRKYLVALIEVDSTTMMSWAQQRIEGLTSYADLCACESVIRLVEGELAKANQKLAQVEQIKCFKILHEELSVENGVMTPTRKKRRKNIETRYKALIDSMYDDEEERLIRQAER